MLLLGGPVPRLDFDGWAMGWDDIARRKELDYEPLRKLIQTRTVTEPGIAYRALLRFREGLGHEASRRGTAGRSVKVGGKAAFPRLDLVDVGDPTVPS